MAANKHHVYFVCPSVSEKKNHCSKQRPRFVSVVVEKLSRFLFRCFKTNFLGPPTHHPPTHRLARSLAVVRHPLVHHVLVEGGILFRRRQALLPALHEHPPHVAVPEFLEKVVAVLLRFQGLPGQKLFLVVVCDAPAPGPLVLPAAAVDVDADAGGPCRCGARWLFRFVVLAVGLACAPGPCAAESLSDRRERQRGIGAAGNAHTGGALGGSHGRCSFFGLGVRVFGSCCVVSNRAETGFCIRVAGNRGFGGCGGTRWGVGLHRDPTSDIQHNSYRSFQGKQALSYNTKPHHTTPHHTKPKVQANPNPRQPKMNFLWQQRVLLLVSALLSATPSPAIASSFVMPSVAGKPSGRPAFVAGRQEIGTGSCASKVLGVSPGGGGDDEETAVPQAESGAEPCATSAPLAASGATPLGPGAKTPPGFLRSRFPRFPWNRVPDYLTYARCLAIPVFVGLFYASLNGTSHLYTGTIFALASATDWFDGFLARRWDISTAFGAFLDPVADKLMVSTSLVLLSGRHGKVAAIPTLIILARELAVSALREWMAQRGERDTVKVGYQGKVKTFLTMTALTVLLYAPAEAGTASILYKVGIPMLYMSALITITSGSVYFMAAAPALLGTKQ
ncbi:unnamed protein product [Pseudo-nitzschia multistriata]|uniref:CDP-diacylglycerol--glycerol-3-phosphate 3-phosphatidyltransferase n=1 Tax=Pseudo-nitzschia multistriata TaxID=183589 RepID=A0A448YVU7_9STRA|nr:unnamed protein product [Pseudo-nitzschia multistriata]